MNSNAHRFLQQLLETPSPSGFEGPIQEVVRDYVAEFADDVQTDVHGNVIVRKNADSGPRLMLAGHCDQIGLLVSHIDDMGYIYTQTIGGWDPIQLVGQRMSIWTAGGKVPGVISRRPIHLLKEEERKSSVTCEELWIDIGASDKEDATSVIRIGDPVTLELGSQSLRNNLINGPGMDNRTGLWVVMEALRRVADSSLRCEVFAVSTVQEEIGLRGARTSAFGVDPQVAIAVDVTHATDCPTIDKRQRGEVAIGDGPVIFRGPNMNHIVTEKLIGHAEEGPLPHQLVAFGRAAPNDANTIQISRAGVATGLVSIPNRYMHSAVETISLDDLDHAAELLAAFARGLSDEDDFTPKSHMK